MEFGLTEEQSMVKRMVADFAAGKVAPAAAEWDGDRWIPDEIIQEMAGLGLFGLPFPEKYGGAGGDTVSYAVAVEELSRGSGSLGITYAAAVSLGSAPFCLFGTEEQKRQWLVPLARGEILACFGLTEPDAGSDAGGTRTTAVLDGSEWILNGSKCFITNAGRAAVAVVTAMTDRDRGTRGISCFIVPADAPGFKVGKRYDKLGLHASDTAELVFEDCRIPRENLLGERGRGLQQSLQTLDGGRISIASLALGIGRASLEESLLYARQRVQFGRPIAKFQAVQFKLADMAMELELARLMTYKAAWLKDRGRRFTLEAAMGKLAASEAAVRAALQAVQIFGGYGYMQEYPVERYLRDAKLCEIGEGTSEIQRLVIARQLGC